jgi:ubiquinone/menaquinone biosynthesis C-methylase UbiE
MTGDPVAAQRRYYAETATTYDDTHERGEHVEALDHVLSYLRRIEAESVLDTGCGTGFALRYLADEMPDLALRGNDPSEELLAVATERYGIPAAQLDACGSEELPYEDGAFDAVIETGMLHHVPDPAPIVAEMLRVARKAVFISDNNAYGMGTLPRRVAKVGLAKSRLLGPVNRLRRGSHDWYYTDGDGIAWTYSVFDSLPQIRRSCAEIVVKPLGIKRRGVERWPLLQASHCLVAGFKAPLPDPTARREP